MAKEHFAFADINRSTKMTVQGALLHIEEGMQLHCLLMESEKYVTIAVWQRKSSFWFPCTDPDNPDLCSFLNSCYLLLRNLNNMSFLVSTDFAIEVWETQIRKILAVTDIIKSFFRQGSKKSFALKKKSSTSFFTFYRRIDSNLQMAYWISVPLRLIKLN